MKPSEFDKKFDEGVEDIIDDLDMSTATRPNKQQKRVNVDFPVWMVESLDREASRARMMQGLDRCSCRNTLGTGRDHGGGQRGGRRTEPD